jgi:hypothetical protein
LLSLGVASKVAASPKDVVKAELFLIAEPD